MISQFETDGIVVIKGAISQNLVRKSVEDIWQHIVNLPWNEKEKNLWKNLASDFSSNPWKSPTKEQTTIATENYPMTGGFAALTLPPAFHLSTQWKVRQSESVISPFREIYGKILGETNPKLMVSLDRVSFKFPGQGTTEFCHWDTNPFFWQEEEYEGLQGIVSLCDTSFFAVPGTHTEEFRKKFVLKYPKSSRKDQYYVKKECDLMGLLGKMVEYKLNKGDLIIWSNRLLHEARKNKTKFIRYAYFISYFPHGKPPCAVKDHQIYKNNNTDWIKDRINSYEQGINPLLYPSGTEICLYSKMHLMCHPDTLDTFCAKFITGNTPYKYKNGKKKDRVVNLPTGWNPKELGIYTPPKLSRIGKELLGYSA